MLFKKLFRILVLGGAVVGSASGCATSAQGQKPTSQKDSPEAATPEAQPKKPESGGGVQGW